MSLLFFVLHIARLKDPLQYIQKLKCFCFIQQNQISWLFRFTRLFFNQPVAVKVCDCRLNATFSSPSRFSSVNSDVLARASFCFPLSTISSIALQKTVLFTKHTNFYSYEITTSLFFLKHTKQDSYTI